VKKLDFPKGKVDEDETALECAVREVHEETNISLRRDQINEDQFVKVETINNRIVTLYFVEGIEDVIKQPTDKREVQERKWIPVSEYIHETFRQSSVDALMGHTTA
jgi:8-oxo-dGTP pyrophosphatase MutT (NUDIX family)